MRNRRDNVLLLGKKRNVSVADLHGSGKEEPVVGYCVVCRTVHVSFWVGRIGQRTVHDTPLAIDNDSIPPMIGACYALHIQDFSRALEIASNDLGMQADGIAA